MVKGFEICTENGVCGFGVFCLDDPFNYGGCGGVVGVGCESCTVFEMLLSEFGGSHANLP